MPSAQPSLQETKTPKTSRPLKMWPLVDVVFTRLFCNPVLLCSLLNAILNLPPDKRLVSVTVENPRIAGKLAKDKDAVVDVRARAADGRRLHIEVQIRTFVAYVARMLFYTAGMYQGQLKKGTSYNELQPVISIHILGFCLLPDEDRFAHYHHVFELLERNLHHRLTDHLEIHLIEMPKFTTEIAGLSTEAAKWLYYLQHGDQMNAAQVHALGVPEIDMADKELLTISQSRKMRVLYEQRLRDEMDKRSYQKDWINEGKRLGFEEGEAKGEAKGKAQGLAMALLQVLEARQLEVGAADRERIMSERDLSVLARWLNRAMTTRATAEIF